MSSSISANSPKVKVHPGLAECVLRERLDLSYRIWLALRGQDGEGRGLMLWEDVERLVVDELGVMARASLYRAFREGDTFFQRSGPYLVLRSLERVCLALDVRPGRPAYVPLDRCRGVAKFRASCLAASFASEHSLDRVISLATLAQRVGRSERTTWSYLRKAGVHVEHNALRSIRPPQTPDAELASNGWYRARQSDGSTEMRKRLPNSYHCNLEQAPLGRARKVRRQLPGHYGGRAQVAFLASRRGRQKGRRAISSMGEGETTFVLWRPPAQRDNAGGILGARLWEGYIQTDGVPHAL